MILRLLAVLLFGLSLLRFVRRVVQEMRRQRTLTWPRATGRLEGETDALRAASVNGEGNITLYHAELEQPYTFYAQGKRYTGTRLAPGLERMNASEAGLFLKELAKHRSYEVYFDPGNPTDNYLTVGGRLLSYGKQLLFLVYGLFVPAALWWRGTVAVPTTLAATVFGVTLGLLAALLALYYLVQPLFNLGNLLLPASGYGPPGTEDELLKSLAERPPAGATPTKEKRTLTNPRA